MRDEPSRKRVDTKEPFLVLVGPPRYKPGRPPVLDLMLVNPTTETLFDVRTDTGGSSSDADTGVMTATGKKLAFGDLVPGGSIKIEEPDIFELPDFVIWWTVTYGEPKTTLNFSLFKNRDGVPISPVPVVGGDGVLIQRR